MDAWMENIRSSREKNTLWMKRQGGYEVGKNHYPLILAVHLLFFTGILAESVWLGATPPSWWPFPFVLFLLVQGLRQWCMQS
jgi:methyltransferase